jgi:DNA-binding IclR family transcriptional regulator
MLAAPLQVEGHAPMVLACVGGSQQMTRARIDRELGPRLLALATQIQAGCLA